MMDPTSTRYLLETWVVSVFICGYGYEYEILSTPYVLADEYLLYPIWTWPIAIPSVAYLN
jgi:hypothetical protein